MVIIIAMKQYLLIPFLFLTLFSVPLSFAQETQTQHPIPKEVHSNSQYQSTNTYPLYDTNATHLPDETYHDPLIDPTASDSDTFQSKFMNMLFLLGLLIGFMLLASWMLKKMSKTRVTQLNQASAIKVVETRYLSPRSTLYLLDVQGQSLLIAESPMGVSYLASLGDALESHEKEEPDSPRTLPAFFSDHSKTKNT